MANAKSETKATPAKGGNKAQSTTMQVKGLIESAGAEGVTALDIATSLGMVNDKTEKIDRAAALKKVRVLARKVSGGRAVTRDGRSAIYKMG